ncbi:hypothetical protein B296_00003735 [Ensete ventricosum]|uniref:Uncharacterized protein n=1 Tax=Ensete ventricosum TaxID=4639 RepID=A0A427B7F1_ENSVE|nr:hypothetical protein B296_00003735 [Ensete ventricosum]
MSFLIQFVCEGRHERSFELYVCVEINELKGLSFSVFFVQLPCCCVGINSNEAYDFEMRAALHHSTGSWHVKIRACMRTKPHAACRWFASAGRGSVGAPRPVQLRSSMDRDGGLRILSNADGGGWSAVKDTEAIGHIRRRFQGSGALKRRSTHRRVGWSGRNRVSCRCWCPPLVTPLWTPVVRKERTQASKSSPFPGDYLGSPIRETRAYIKRLQPTIGSG